MICPNCKTDSISYKSAVFASRNNPVVCGNCGKSFWVHRILSTILDTAAHGYGVGIVILLLIFFYKWYLGVAIVGIFAVMRTVIGAYELWLHGLKECEVKQKT